MSDLLADYEYNLPDEQIAREPAAQRDSARMLVVHRQSGELVDASIRDLPRFLQSGDCLVLNDTRVLPARLHGIRLATGGHWEGLYLESRPEGVWRLLGQTRGKLQPGEQLALRPWPPATGREICLTLLEKDSEGVWLARPDDTRSAIDILQDIGTVPLPPYMERDIPHAGDVERYQTVYAAAAGSVAAPTAGLHFTSQLLDDCAAEGIKRAPVTLHVGLGTFRPIAVERLADHQMHSEWCTVSPTTARQINTVRSLGGRCVAVGTTSVRTLESAAADGQVRPWSGDTSLYIRPPYRFQAVDALLTNFHLPRSSLLVLVSAFAGRELVRTAYQHAIEQKYRFFSYGDAMLIL